MSGKARARRAYLKEDLRRKVVKKSFALLLIVILLGIILLGSLFTLLFERGTNPEIQTYGDAVWLSFVTITTVGYGDSVPITAGGRATCIVSMVLGISLLSLYISTRAALRVEKVKRRARGLQRSIKLRDHFVVCGWNGRGSYVLSALEQGTEKERTPIALLCDLEEKPVDDDYVFFIRGSQVTEKDLRRANISEARAAILLADEETGGKKDDIDARTVLSALTARSINPEIQMTAEVLDPENIHHLKRAGVGEILDSDSLGGNLMARSALHYGLIGIVSELVAAGAKRLYRVSVNEEMAGMDYGELLSYLQRDQGCTLVGVGSGGRIQTAEVGRVSQGDTLFLLSEKKPPGALE